MTEYDHEFEFPGPRDKKTPLKTKIIIALMICAILTILVFG